MLVILSKRESPKKGRVVVTTPRRVPLTENTPDRSLRSNPEAKKLQEVQHKEHMQKLAEAMTEIKAVVDDIPNKLSKHLRDKVDFKEFYVKEVLGFPSSAAFDKEVLHIRSLAAEKYDYERAIQALHDVTKTFKRIQGAIRAEGGESREKKLFKLIFKESFEEMEQAVRDFQCINTYKQNVNVHRQRLRKEDEQRGGRKTHEKLTDEATRYVLENTVPKEIERSKKRGELPKYCDLQLLLNPTTPKSKKRIERALATGGNSPQKIYNSYTDTMGKFRPVLKGLVLIFGEALLKDLTLFKMKEMIQSIKRALLETLGLVRFASLVPSDIFSGLSKREGSGKTPYWDVGYQPATRHEPAQVSESTWLQDNLSRMGGWEPVDIYDRVKQYLLDSISAAKEARNGRSVKKLSESLGQWQSSHSRKVDELRSGKVANATLVAKVKESLLVHAGNIAMKSLGMAAEPHDPRHMNPSGQKDMPFTKRF